MADIKLKVSRDRLAQFIKDPETLKQFERLINYINELIPQDQTDLATNVVSIESQLNALRDLLTESNIDLSTALETLPRGNENYIYELEKRIEALENRPTDYLSFLHENSKVVNYHLGVDIPFINSWVEFDSQQRTQINRIGNICFMSGLVKNGTAKEIITLPEYLRPKYDWIGITPGSTKIPRFTGVRSNGTVESDGFDSVWTSIKLSWVIGA